GNPADDGQIIALSDPNNGWQLKTSADSGKRTFAVAISPDGVSHTQRNGNIVISLNTWYHVAGVFNAEARTLDLFVNGVLDDGLLQSESDGPSIPAVQVIPSGVNVNIGRRTGGSGYYFIGTIDEVRVYSRALLQPEIQSDMNTPVLSATDTQPPTTPTNLAANAVSGTEIDLTWTAATDNIGVT